MTRCKEEILLILSSYYREATMVRSSFVPGGQGRVNGSTYYEDFAVGGGLIQSAPICEICGQQKAPGRCLQCCSMSTPCAEQDWGAPPLPGVGRREWFDGSCPPRLKPWATHYGFRHTVMPTQAWAYTRRPGRLAREINLDDQRCTTPRGA